MLLHQPIQNNAELSDIRRRKIKNKWFLSFPNAEGLRTDELSCSQMRKAFGRTIYSIPKCGKLPVGRFIAFPNAEGFRSGDLSRSQMRKGCEQTNYVVPKCGKLPVTRFIAFPNAENTRTLNYGESQKLKY